MTLVLIATAIVGVIGLICGIGLSVASVCLEVPVDEKTLAAREALPGANCGGCGYSGCDAYAEAVAKGDAETVLCSPGGAETAKKLAEIAGVQASFIAKKAHLICSGNCENTTETFKYSGMGGCSAIAATLGGNSSCSFGCLKAGDCTLVCDYNAITLSEGGLPVIDEDNCTGCGKCVRACPRGIIELLPKSEPKPMVKCKNQDKGALAKNACKVACIGCGLCLKQCEFDAIAMENNLAVINREKCTLCGKCVSKCPMKCIVIE